MPLVIVCQWLKYKYIFFAIVLPSTVYSINCIWSVTLAILSENWSL